MTEREGGGDRVKKVLGKGEGEQERGTCKRFSDREVSEKDSDRGHPCRRRSRLHLQRRGGMLQLKASPSHT